MSFRAFVLGVLLVSAVPLVAGAQPADPEMARRDLILQAEQARAAGDYQQALDLAVRVGQMRMTPSARLLIAQAHDALGHLLQALDAARQCAREAQQDRALRNREVILDTCNSLATSLEPRIGRLRVMLPEPCPEGLRVRVAGRDLDHALVGVAFPVLPGTTLVEATVEGAPYFRRSVDVTAGQTTEVRVTTGPGTSASASSGTTQPVPVTARPVARSDRGARRRAGIGVGPFVVAGVGVVSFALAGVFWVLHGSARMDRDAACPPAPARCEAEAIDLDASMRNWTLATNITLGLGAAAIAGAVVWFGVRMAGRRREAPRTASGFTLSPAAGGGLISYTGVF